MTLQDLKDNRNEIIATITEKAGIENVAVVMNLMVKNVSMFDSIEEAIDMSLSMFEDTRHEVKPRKESKLAAMMANNHEGEYYNTLTKNWEKQ